MSNPTLRPLCSVVVLTYNRPERLVERLNEIVPHMNIYPIECLVISNGSPNDLTSIIDAFPLVEFVVNDYNIGLSGSFFSAFRKSRGQFTWIVSDDDILNFDSAMKFLMTETVRAPHYVSKWNPIQTSQSVSELEILAGLSNQIFLTSAAKDAINQLANEINPTYPQILLSIALGFKFSILPFPLFTDLGVTKDYSAAAAFKVHIRDKVLLTRQCRKLNSQVEWIHAIDSWAIANLLNYSLVQFGEHATNGSRQHHAKRLRHLLRVSPPRIRLLIAFMVMGLEVWGLLPPLIRNYSLRKLLSFVNPQLIVTLDGYPYQESLISTYPDYDSDKER